MRIQVTHINGQIVSVGEAPQDTGALGTISVEYHLKNNTWQKSTYGDHVCGATTNHKFIVQKDVPRLMQKILRVKTVAALKKQTQIGAFKRHKIEFIG